MLSDEEKKAIKEVKHFNQLTRYWQEEEYEEKEIAEYITTILNLIEKQSKEIEELKQKEKEPTPTEPVEIKNENYIFGNIEGQPINIPYNPKVERLKYFQKVNGKWQAVFESLEKE